MTPIKAIILWGLAWGALCLGQPLTAFSDGVKTHYKEYTLFTYENADYLCEPYTVKKDDWLYKILRQKGEISASDFSKFLKIFKKLNPKISNIDAIAPGIQIIIPLKQVDRQAYVQKEEGIVEVPVLEFSLDFGEKEVKSFIRRHRVQPGDTFSTLLGKEFLKKGGEVSEIGEKTVLTLNPEIRDINRIYAGAHVLIPNPGILSQPWLKNFIDTGLSDISQEPDLLGIKPGADPPTPFILSPGDLGRLKRYAQLIQGTLLDEGKVFFPKKQGQPSGVLDLSKTPLLEEASGQKTLVLPPDAPVDYMDQDLVAAMKAYWKGVRLQELNKTLAEQKSDPKKEMNQRPRSLDALIKTLISITSLTYAPQASFPIQLKSLEMTVTLGRITHDTMPDLLVNTGNVYGQALEALGQQGYEILTLSPDNTFGETIRLLFSKLGYTTWENPSFNTNGTVQGIQGIYLKRGTEKYFIARTPPPEYAKDFLENENIHLLLLDEDPAL